MKLVLVIVSVFLMGVPFIFQKNHEDMDLPELHKIKRITLSPSYSCRPAQDFQKGYASTAFFCRIDCAGRCFSSTAHATHGG